MRTEPTIVTAFFDLKRGEWENSPRAIGEYLKAFEFWAGIRNKLIVYTDAEVAKEVTRIRRKKGLESVTEIVIVGDYLSLDPDLYHSIEKAMSKESSRAFHLKPQNPESCNPAYNYVMLLKWWCVCDAINRGSTSENVAWIDFGFNNCGTYYTNPKEFEFTWTVELEDKMNLFCLNELDDTPIFEVVQKMDTYFQGGSIVGPASLWQRFAVDVRSSMLEMNDVGFADDDQVIILMAYRKNRDMFKINLCDWFSAFEVTSDKKFTIRRSQVPIGIKGKLKEIKKKYNELKTVEEYLRRQKKILLTRNVKKR